MKAPRCLFGRAYGPKNSTTTTLLVSAQYAATYVRRGWTLVGFDPEDEHEYSAEFLARVREQLVHATRGDV